MPLTFEKGEPDYYNVYFRNDKESGCFTAPCSLPLTLENIEECRQSVVDALSFTTGGESLTTVLLVIPGGKA